MKKIISVTMSFLLMFNILVVNTHVLAEESSKRLSVVNVIASADDGNLPINTNDNLSDTRWSAANDVNGNGPWIKYDLGESKEIGFIGIAFHQGDKRYTMIDIEVSDDDVNWTTVYSGQSSAQTLDMEKFDIENTKARYVKITGHGYTYYDGSKSGAWTSILETHFYSSDSDSMDAMELSEVAKDVKYTKVGLYNSDNSVHEVHTANSVTKDSINISTFKIDLENNDGDDAPEIQAAINAASSGEEIYFPNGTYNLKSSLILKTGVNLRGESKEKTIFIAEKNSEGNYSDNVFEMWGQNNIAISDLTITSTFSGNYSTDHQTNNPEADGPKYVIRIEDATSTHTPSYNITIDNVLIEKYQTMGVRISKSHDVVVKNSTFQNATDVGGGGAGYGVSIQGEGNNVNRLGYMNDTRFNVVENCTFQGPYLRHGALIQYYAHNNMIRNNTFIQTKLDAIDLHGEDEYLNEIYGNTITDIETGAGVGVGNTGATHDKSGPGNYIHDNIITNCREGVKVHLGSEDTVISNNIITGSTVDSAKGIYLQNAPGTIIKNNIIKDNTSKDFWALIIEADPGTDNRGSGIAENVTVEDNAFNNCTNGIKITAGTNISVNNNSYDSIINEKVLDSRTYSYAEQLLPSQVLDLTNWKVTLPINNAQEITQPALNSYESEYFYVNDTSDAVIFNAPVAADGTDATTVNSSYPRSELREMTNNGASKASWSTTEGKHTMIIDEKITNTPVVKPHVVVGQIHDAVDDVIMIRLEGTKLFVQAESIDLGTLDSEYQIGTRFKIKVEVENGFINIYYNDELKVEYAAEKVGCYFKAGMYTQSNLSKGDAAEAYGEVEIYDLSVTHSGEEATTPDDSTDSSGNSVDIPDREADNVINPSMDTYVELSSGKATEEVKNEKDTLYVKMSGGQTTIRAGLVEFDATNLELTSASALSLNLTAKSVSAATSISVYGTVNSWNTALVWTDLGFTDSSRYEKEVDSVMNTDIKDWLNGLTKIGEISVEASTTEQQYSINVSDFVNDNLDADKFTFVLFDETASNSNVYFYSSEKEGSKPELKIWNKAVEFIATGIIPETAGDVVLNPTIDTIVELSSGKATDDTTNSLLNKDTLYIKTTSGETTIRLGVMKFDKSSVSKDIDAAQIRLSASSVSKDTTISVYGTTYDWDTINWNDIFTETSRFSKDNTEIPDWLEANATKIGEINMFLGVSEYKFNLTDFVNNDLSSDKFSIILVNEIKDSSDVKIYSNDKTIEELKPELSIWYPSISSNTNTTDTNTADTNEDETVPTKPAETAAETAVDANAVDRALSLVCYDSLKLTNDGITLPTLVGSDVVVSWVSGNVNLIDNTGLVKAASKNLDVTLTATFTKNNEITTKEFIFIVEGNETPDATTPDATTPDGTTPDATTPDATTPDATTPDATTPDTTTPDTTTPETTTTAPSEVVEKLKDKINNSSVVEAGKNSDELIQAISKIVKDNQLKEGISFEIDITSKATVSKDIFEAIQGKNINVKFAKNGVQWSINGKDINAESLATIGDIDLSLKDVSAELQGKIIDKVYNVMGKDVELFPFSYNYDGELPGMFSVKVFVGKNWAGKIINVYRYYPEKDMYKEVDSNIKVDSEGYMEYDTNHCSDYFITESVAKLPQTGSRIDINILIMLGLTIIAAGVVLIRKKDLN
ncbi:polysaccharide lyase family 7 protein [Clostridium grantii]|uniref:LPXTG-motif cell wall anchor domain-containing protein n=1 Tax=Clostridium grantii DSM 8605 TaxID=1121316 RepID=A0A1M5T5P6_9CLOT|nr:polysaccharide lyase family 7 protein [Clostridium grantii]SHH45683.1 LPXTG-motif cell wall anchor domain-containing protein [Clostridium grantii DSM 8605]